MSKLVATDQVEHADDEHAGLELDAAEEPVHHGDPHPQYLKQEVRGAARCIWRVLVTSTECPTGLKLLSPL